MVAMQQFQQQPQDFRFPTFEKSGRFMDDRDRDVEVVIR